VGEVAHNAQEFQRGLGLQDKRQIRTVKKAFADSYVVDNLKKTPAMRKVDEENKLPSLSLVFGYIAVKELRRLEDRVDVLSRLGYGNASIALICGTTVQTVAALKYRARKGRRKK